MAAARRVYGAPPSWARGEPRSEFAETMLRFCGPDWRRMDDAALYGVYERVIGKRMEPDREAYLRTLHGAAKRALLCRFIAEAAKNEPGSGAFPEERVAPEEVLRGREVRERIGGKEFGRFEVDLDAAPRRVRGINRDARASLYPMRHDSLTTPRDPDELWANTEAKVEQARQLIAIAGLEGRLDPATLTLGQYLAVLAVIRALPLVE